MCRTLNGTLKRWKMPQHRRVQFALLNLDTPSIAFVRFLLLGQTTLSLLGQREEALRDDRVPI